MGAMPRSLVTIDLAAIRHNVRTLRGLLHGTELWAAELAGDGTIAGERLVAGGPEESILQPLWSPAGELWFASDRTGWWNLYAVAPDAFSSAAGDGSADGELGEAFWAGAGYCGYLRESWGPGRAERTGVWSNPEYLRMVGMDMKELQRR